MLAPSPFRPATTGPPSPRATALRWGLATLWIVDAGLQLQPAMFTRSFSGNVLYNAALMYQPAWLEHLLYNAASLEAQHLKALTVAIAVIELCLGVGLLLPATRRPALTASIGWALMVWIFGQGFGFMATGTALVEFGAPGSAFLYLVLAALLWRYFTPRPGPGMEIWLQTRLRVFWSGFWMMGALLHIPVRYPPGALLAYNIQTAAQLQPQALAVLDYHLARFAYAQGAGVSLTLAVFEVGLAAAIWIPRLRRTSLVLGIGATLGFWVFGQALGGVLSGVSPDLNSAPVILLLGSVLLFPRSLERQQHRWPSGAPMAATLPGAERLTDSRAAQTARADDD